MKPKLREIPFWIKQRHYNSIDFNLNRNLFEQVNSLHSLKFLFFYYEVLHHLLTFFSICHFIYFFHLNLNSYVIYYFVINIFENRSRYFWNNFQYLFLFRIVNLLISRYFGNDISIYFFGIFLKSKGFSSIFI